MTHEGALFVQWIKSPQQGRADVYRITFATYQNPERMLFTQEVRTEGDVRRFMDEEISCTEDAISESVRDLGRQARTRINYIQLSEEVLANLQRAEK